MQLKKNIVISDANVILRYLLDDNSVLYSKAELFFKKVSRGSIIAFIDHAVLAEVVYVLTRVYKIARDEVARVLIEFISQRGIFIEDKEIIVTSLKIFSNSNFDYVDCLLCAYSNKYQVLSFDNDVNKYIAKKINTG